MDLSFFSSSPCSDFASFDDDDEVLLELLLLLEAAPSRESIPREEEEEEEEEPFPSAAIRLGRTPPPLMLLPATEGDGDRDDTANATMAVAHTAPIALPYALLCDDDDDFFVDSFVVVVLARPPSLSIKEEEPSKVCVSSDVVLCTGSNRRAPGPTPQASSRHVPERKDKVRRPRRARRRHLPQLAFVECCAQTLGRSAKSARR